MRSRTLLLVVALILPALAYPHTGEKNPEVRYRHAVMEAMANHFAAMAMIFKNEVNRPDELQHHARALAESATLIEGLFPEDSQGGDALPLIWEEPDKVAEAARQAAQSAADLAAAATSGDRAAFVRAFKAAGDSCKGCHERYKEEDEGDHQD